MFSGATSSSNNFVSWSRHLFLIFLPLSFLIKNSSSEEVKNRLSDFHTSLENGVYVDKSLLISELLEREEKVVQITRPRRWGKTMNLNLIKTFFEVEFNSDGKPLPGEKRRNGVLFTGGEWKSDRGTKVIEPLKIAGVKSAMEKMGKHPVIYLSLREVKGKSVNEIGEKLNKAIVELYRGFPFLAKYLDNKTTILDEDEIPRLKNFLNGNLEKEYIFDSLEFLSMMLFEHFDSYVCLLIDDYDLPLVNAFMTFGQRSEFEVVEGMFKRLYEYSFKENQYLLKGVVTGTLSFDVVPSGAGEFDYKYILYNGVFDEPFSGHFGFTEAEVGKLVQNVHKMDDLKQWYGGYFINQTEIYNPGSVVGYLREQEFKYFLMHVPSDMATFANKGFLSAQSQEFLLLCGESKEIVISEFSKTVPSRNVARDFHSVFVNLGYLNLITPKRYAKEEIWRVTIPNRDVRGVFATGFQLWIAAELDITEGESRTLTNCLAHHDVDKFAMTLETVLSGADYDLRTNQNRYHDLMAAVFASLGVGNEVGSIRQVDSSQGEGVVVPLQGFGSVVTHLEYNICKATQNVSNIVEESLQSLLRRPPSCTEKYRRHRHVEKILYVAVAFLGYKVSIRSKTVDSRK